MAVDTGGCQLLLFLCVVLKTCGSLHNDATELLSAHVASTLQETPSNMSLNGARDGGRSTDDQVEIDRSQLGCRELRSTKYISDGQCTSVQAVKELVCAGECLPAHLLPNWIGGSYWARRDARSWRCVNDATRMKRVKLRCRDGSTRSYRIAAVTSCTCKRLARRHNESGPLQDSKGEKNEGKS
ncbi:sclerostin domain-containing protein 1b [Pygocentrus nattereri]|uniref:sclerostin domain-containing protein 1b n=1 Tax=Pygocentrus nattereri TaxID=42514 RepID=UPI00081488EB|nr:sclerostin domain-containing protein 1b [Pygocentrus nattereri]